MNYDISVELQLRLYTTMLRIRIFEERVADLLEANEVKCPVHLYIGQEAIAAGICAALQQDDYIFGTHRSHGHYLAKGGNMRQMMAELFGKRTGCSKGRGGSMHLVAPEVGLLSTAPLVSGTVPIAVGAALASKLRAEDRVSVVFFGDGVVDEGVFHESMNFAALKKLPVIFVCENNFFATHLHISERRASDNIVKIADIYGMTGVRVDGNNVVEVYYAAVEAIARARGGEGPTLLECRTYRWRGHVGPKWDLDVGLRRKQELPEWLAKDPIARLKKLLLDDGAVSQEGLERVSGDVEQEVEDSIMRARQAPLPREEELMHYVFRESKKQESGLAQD